MQTRYSDWKLTISAVDFDRSDIDNVTPEWLEGKMEKLNIKAKHISTYTGIDKSTLSSILSGAKLTKWQKVAFITSSSTGKFRSLRVELNYHFPTSGKWSHKNYSI